jgi:hypothetical protein
MWFFIISIRNTNLLFLFAYSDFKHARRDCRFVPTSAVGRGQCGFIVRYSGGSPTNKREKLFYLE